MDLNDDLAKELEVKKTYNQARLAAMNMLARREHSKKEIENKLNARFEHSVVEKILDDLVSEGLQSDERFIESFISSKVNSGQGPLKISYELRNKGVSSEEVTAQLEVYKDEWLSLAREVLHRKFGDVPPENHKEKQKRQRFIASRGFPNNICYQLF